MSPCSFAATARSYQGRAASNWSRLDRHRKTTFHSLRHNYRDALRDTEMSGEMVRALGGWSGGGSTSDDYGSGFTPERLYGAIQAIDMDRLDLWHLCLR